MNKNLHLSFFLSFFLSCDYHFYYCLIQKPRSNWPSEFLFFTNRFEMNSWKRKYLEKSSNIFIL